MTTQSCYVPIIVKSVRKVPKYGIVPWLINCDKNREISM